MYSCDHCSKSFLSYRSLNGHKRIHAPVMGGRSGSKVEPGCCEHCQSSIARRSHSEVRRFCSNQCQRDFSWQNIKIEILAGTYSAKFDTRTVRKFLIERDGYACARCAISEWMGAAISLDIDHIDGDPKNNDPANWRFLCPNCHRQTDTWGNSQLKRKLNNGRHVASRM